MAKISIELDESSVELEFFAGAWSTAEIAKQLSLALQSVGLNPEAVAKAMLKDEDNATPTEV